ncbi:MAG: hypothetical protein J6C06_06020 [Lachnospiraceae bacterium]|nr:hypothetical protein [Lachnospiraceae bacterium]
MTEAKKKELLSWVCIILGGIFVVAGLVLFIMSNRMNLQMRKTEATILSHYDLIQENGLKHTMLELIYNVGGQNVMATYEYPGVLEEDVYYIDIYYNIKEPSMVFDVGWSMSPLLVSVLGLIVLITGLYMKQIIKGTWWQLKEPEKNAQKNIKELYLAKRRVYEGALPMLAGILFVAFGIIMLVSRGEWWAWIFIVLGAVELLYIGMDFVPGLIQWINLGKIVKAQSRAKVYSVEMEEESKEPDKDNK